VFVLVGLAAASILLWIFFAVRRRRRTRRLEHDTAVSATLAAAGFHRTPLDDDDDRVNSARQSRFGSPDVEMNQRTSSGFASGTNSSVPSGGRISAYMDSPHPDDQDAFNPYTDYIVPPGARDGYVAGRTASPPPVAFYNGPYRERTGSGSAGDHIISHSASHSAGSYEPLLASFYQPGGSSSPIRTTSPPSPPPRNPQRLSDAGRPIPAVVLPSSSPEPNLGDNNFGSGASSLYSSESTGDVRLDPGLRQRLNEEVDRASARDLRDDEDYSRPVLGVSPFFEILDISRPHLSQIGSKSTGREQASFVRILDGRLYIPVSQCTLPIFPMLSPPGLTYPLSPTHTAGAKAYGQRIYSCKIFTTHGLPCPQ
jgi:hypothetical protein